ncbi:MAG TPA: hypothetical protein DEP05_10485 [Betaproteobacteria bacterium]|nr:hypothetical protein [Betaproteobacteria bacterium]
MDKMGGILKQYEKHLILRHETPTNIIRLIPSGDEIIATHVGMNRFEFRNKISNRMILYAVPPQLKQYGIFAWLTTVCFYEKETKVAEVNYKHFLGKPQFSVNDVHCPVEEIITGEQRILKSEHFTLYQSQNMSDGGFEVFEEAYLYPCMGFLAYLISFNGST